MISLPDVLEYFYPGKENHDSDHVVVLHLPVGEKFEIGVDFGFPKQLFQQRVDFHGPIDVKSHGYQRQLRKNSMRH